MIAKKVVSIFLLCCTLALILVACGNTDPGDAGGSRNSSPDGGSGNTAHMNNMDFLQSSITIHKGENITLVADTFAPHRIANGTWQNGEAKPAKEPGAPEIDGVMINGNSSSTLGPFNTAGTFQLYCTIHPGMNLTVIVQ
jgi:plastocyanin